MSPIVPSMSDRDGKIWMDGQLVDWRDAKIHVLTHTLHYGCGAFEGVRAYKTANGTAIFRLQEHTERLYNSAKILRMKIPFSQEQFNEAQKQVVRENQLETCYLRPLVWIGSQKLGVSPKGNTIHAEHFQGHEAQVVRPLRGEEEEQCAQQPVHQPRGMKE